MSETAPPAVSSSTSPVRGAVHDHHTERRISPAPWAGSPGSIVASVLSRRSEPLSPASAAAAARSSFAGRPGRGAITVHLAVALWLPSLGFAELTLNLRGPFAMPVYVTGDVHGAEVPLSSQHQKLAGPSAVNVNVADDDATTPLGPPVIVTLLPSLSTTMFRTTSVTSPEAEYARITIAVGPSGSLSSSQKYEYGGRP